MGEDLEKEAQEEEQERNENPIEAARRKGEELVETEVYKRLVDSKRIDYSNWAPDFNDYIRYDGCKRLQPLWYGSGYYTKLADFGFRFNGETYYIKIAVGGQRQFKASIRINGKKYECDQDTYYSETGRDDLSISNFLDTLRENKIYSDDDFVILGTPEAEANVDNKPVIDIEQNMYYEFSVSKSYRSSMQTLLQETIGADDVLGRLDPKYLLNLVIELATKKKKTTVGWGS
jgi:hypothetical protein